MTYNPKEIMLGAFAVIFGLTVYFGLYPTVANFGNPTAQGATGVVALLLPLIPLVYILLPFGVIFAAVKIK